MLNTTEEEHFTWYVKSKSEIINWEERYSCA